MVTEISRAAWKGDWGVALGHPTAYVKRIFKNAGTWTTPSFPLPTTEIRALII